MGRIRVLDSIGSLCDTCRFAIRRRAVNTNRNFIICTVNQMGRSEMTSPMEFCDTYSNKTELQLFEMKKLAWVVDIKKNSIGFTVPDDLIKEHGEPEVLRDLEEKLPWQLR